MSESTEPIAVTDCYCCTCDREGDYVRQWAPDCRNHGAHGVAACERHGLPAEKCGCGCDG